MKYAAVLRRVERIGWEAIDSRTLRAAVLDEIGAVVPFDAYIWPLTDPETSVGTAPLVSIPPPLMPELPRLIRLRYRTPVNRWTHLSAAARLEQPADCLVWRELLHGHGVTDVASAVFRDRFGCWAFLDLWRHGGEFGRDEIMFLDDVALIITSALRRCEAFTFSVTDTDGGEAPAVLVLDANLSVLGQTPPTRDYLARLLRPDAGVDPVPAAVYNVAAQLLAVEAGIDDQPAVARVHIAGGQWLTLRAAPLGPADQIGVTIEQTSPRDRTAIFARAHGLSAWETQVLHELTTGADIRTIAARTLLSENAVHDHLKLVFDKTGTRSRRILLSRAVGTE